MIEQALVREAMSLAANVTLATVALVFAFSAGRWVGRRQPDTGTDIDRRPLVRDAPSIEVLAEDDDGYGIALRDMDDFVTICAFDADDRVYEEIDVFEKDYEPLANALSVRACEQERDGDG
jgi:hypothetical protein